MSGWEVGDLALCVDATTKRLDAPCPLVEGRVYTVTGMERAICPVFGDGLGLFLAEIECPTQNGFLALRFRKVQPDAHEGHADDWQALFEQHKRKVSA